MRQGIFIAATAVALTQWAHAQQAPPIQTQPDPPQQTRPTEAEQEELMRAVSEGSNSTLDLVRVFEAFLQKHPDTQYRPDIELNLTKASIENKDDARVVLYGERVLAHSPDDVTTLDRVAQSLVTLGGKENAEKALKYARAFEAIIDGLQVPSGADAPQIQEERDRAHARMLVTEARAQAILDDKEESRRMAERAFALYPDEETARALAESLIRLGRDQEAIARLAEAFEIPDSRASSSDRLNDRLRLGEMWAKAHKGSEQGLGDEILAAYDRSYSMVEIRHKKLLALDPNGAAANATEFTISGLDGKKLQMSSLLGKVVVLDFWATWCAPCRVEYPIYQEVKKHYANRPDVVFLPLTTDEDHSIVQPFLESQMWDQHVYFDDGLTRVLGVSQIPTTLLLNKQGQVSSRMNGFAPELFKDQLIERIEAALADTSGSRP
ncbi:MAG TPA: redoxin domain-containing protein [Bryobacteraceae bacterium]